MCCTHSQFPYTPDVVICINIFEAETHAQSHHQHYSLNIEYINECAHMYALCIRISIIHKLRSHVLFMNKTYWRQKQYSFQRSFAGGLRSHIHMLVTEFKHEAGNQIRWKQIEQTERMQGSIKRVMFICSSAFFTCKLENIRRSEAIVCMIWNMKKNTYNRNKDGMCRSIIHTRAVQLAAIICNNNGAARKATIPTMPNDSVIYVEWKNNRFRTFKAFFLWSPLSSIRRRVEWTHKSYRQFEQNAINMIKSGSSFTCGRFMDKWTGVRIFVCKRAENNRRMFIFSRQFCSFIEFGLDMYVRILVSLSVAPSVVVLCN